MRYFRIQRRFWSTIPGKLVIAFSLLLLLVGLLVLSPLWLPVVLIAHWGERRRLVKAARAFHCTKCGAQLSKTSLQLADKEWTRRMQQRRKEFPGVRCRVVRLLDAICVECGQEYRFDRASGFVAIEATIHDDLAKQKA